MTVNDLITKINAEKKSPFTTEKLIGFLNEIEQDVAEQLLLAKEDIPEYTTSDLTEELLAPEPYSRLYVSYLKSQIDYALEEYPSYQLNRDQHVQDFRDFVDYVVKDRVAEERSTFPRRIINIM